jgi:hypothetical protein
MIVLPGMPEEQTASWLGILDLYEHLSGGGLSSVDNLFICIAPSVAIPRSDRPMTPTP